MEKDAKFEQKVDELEKIINELENGNIELEESIEKYMYAMKLAKECDDKLKAVEEKVNKILSENGEIKDFELMD